MTTQVPLADAGDIGAAETANNLGVLMIRQKKWQQAQVQLTRACSIYEAKLGPLHSTVARVAQNLAMLLNSQHQYRDALVYFLKSLKAQQSLPDQLDHLNLLNRAQGSVRVYGLKGKTAK
eukprot:CAMPEP_0114546496 /NCGR_PEP_ID=MMETSP0114-20121206/3965_1 /TAXON_ID=31324 /ORGANISM="Goniomonas sp, Strain m" /LENGTH=119 /DNA_ID=CAMNT_0001730995 /DNA_START=34 /DNA_END=391 /DNA_ORIENTATION=-